jgi:F-type H+-transporting ATPase subunit c
MVCMLCGGPAIAEEMAQVTSSSSGGFDKAGALAIASGLGIAIAAFGGALGQGKAAAATLEGIARNPGASGKLLTPMIIALALIESLVIYALVIAFLLQGKI